MPKVLSGRVRSALLIGRLVVSPPEVGTLPAAVRKICVTADGVPVLLGTAMLVSGTVVLAGLLTDIGYALVDALAKDIASAAGVADPKQATGEVAIITATQPDSSDVPSGPVAVAVTPRAYPLIAYSKPWTPGTNGLVRGEVVLVTETTEEDLKAKYAGGKLKGGLHLKGASISKVGPRSFSLTDGVLTLRLPKSPKDTPRKVAIG